VEELTAAPAGFRTEAFRSARQAALWIALPLGIVAFLPIVVVMLRELAAIDVPVRGLRDGLIACLVACPALCAAVVLRLRLKQRSSWGSDAIVATLVAGGVLSSAAGGNIPLPELLLVGYSVGALLFDYAATWRPRWASGPISVSYKVR
jgi:hypothetical protein